MRLWALCLLCALGCSDEPKKPSSSPPKTELPTVAQAPVQPVFRGARVTQLSGEISTLPALAQGARLAAGQRLRLSDGATLVLALESGVRIDVKGPALISAAHRSDQGLHVREGSVKVELPPGGAEAGAGSAFVATPLGALHLGRSARFVLRVAPSGRAQLAVVSGRVSVDSLWHGAAKREQRVVEAGRLLDVMLRQSARELAGPSTFDAAERALAHDPPEPERNGADFMSFLVGRLVLALAGAEVEIERQKGLDLEHQVAHKARAPNVMEIQRRIAEQAALSFRARRDVEAILLQVETARLSYEGPDAPDPMIAKAQALLQ